jgi:hypothetical protein
MAQHGTCLTFIIDNAFDNGIDKSDNSKSAVMELTRFAFDCGHHLIIISQTEEGADEIGDLNGARTRIAPQQNGKRAEDYRWGEDLASQYLNETVLAESKKRNSTVADIRREWLNATRMRDRFGGWNPTIMSLYVRGYLQLVEEPRTRGRLLFLGKFRSFLEGTLLFSCFMRHFHVVSSTLFHFVAWVMEVVLHGFNINPSEGYLQGKASSQQSAVWVRQLRKDGYWTQQTVD